MPDSQRPGPKETFPVHYSASAASAARRMIVAAGLALALAACASKPPAPPPASPAPAEQPPAQPAPAKEPVALKPQHPLRYVVRKGDTLWDISNMFLQSPWLWPEIWYVNPQIKNPHLIFPGDVITLTYVNGKPRLSLTRGQPSVHLSPKVRIEPLAQAIPTIPIDAIRPFLTRPEVVGADELDNSPYILRTIDGRLMTGAQGKVYVRGQNAADGSSYTILRKSQPLLDPQTGEVLGYQALYVGALKIQQWGDPATAAVTQSSEEVMAGDRLIPTSNETLTSHFTPRAPAREVHAQIIDILGGLAEAGQYQVVVLDRGTRDGLELGNVLAIYQHGEKIEDPYASKGFLGGGDKVQLPDRRAGVAMVFRTFNRVSYALIMQSTSEIHLLDMARNP